MSALAYGKARGIRCTILLPLILATVCFGQQPGSLATAGTQAEPQPALTPRSGPGLQISPGDLVNFHVYDTPELDQTARVSQSGDVVLPLLGEVHVASLTPEEAAHKVESILITKNLMKSPSVVVTVTGYETELVSVNGQVAHPGMQQITTPRSAIDLITLSGGLTDLADRHILIRRRGSPDNVVTFYDSNDSAEAVRNDVLVYPGDTMIVPRVGIIYVLGDVGRPGGFPIDQPDSRMTALKAVALAGATLPSASPADARLIHKSADGVIQETKLNFSRIQRGKAPDVELEAGDVLYIPFSYSKNFLSLGSSEVLASVAGAALYAH